MGENRISETLDNILDGIDRLVDGIGNYNKPEIEMSLSASVFALVRAYDMLAQYDDIGYIEDGEDE